MTVHLFTFLLLWIGPKGEIGRDTIFEVQISLKDQNSILNEIYKSESLNCSSVITLVSVPFKGIIHKHREINIYSKGS